MEDIGLAEKICLAELRSAFVDRSSDWRRANVERLTYLAEELTKIDFGYSFLISSFKESKAYKI